MNVVNIAAKNPIPEEKCKEALDFIFDNAFKSGFGTLGKSDLDLILFEAVLKYSDNKSKSDLELSKYLQITQQRIRALKEKASVKFPAIDRKEAIDQFLEKAKKAKVDDKYIDVPINDISVKNEIEGWLDELDIVLHSQLNPKVFRLRIDDFMELLLAMDAELSKNNNFQSIESKYDSILHYVKDNAQKGNEAVSKIFKSDDDISNLTKKSLKEAMVKGGISVGLDLLASFIPGGIILARPIKELIAVVRDKV
jgi:hypothetical protein